ncbi:hypothetical protein BX666DRAFT_827920 [Dichotomocladium elegans]|nr:hypothetical protein BX666DRAFT_827920 [Dichotomocladium elegans]
MSTIQRPSKDRPFPLQAATPLSALSPPPRHAMKERSRSMTVDSSTPWPSSSSPLFHKEEHQESLPLPLKQKASTIGPSRALRLSLDIEQQYSSSPSSISDLHKKDEQDDASSCTSSNRVRGAATPDPKFRLSSIEASTPSAGGQQAEKRLSLIERRQRTSATIPDIEKLNIFYNESGLDDHVKHGDEEDGDYEKLLSEFRLPSETLPPSSSPVPVAVKENKEKREEAHHSHTRPPMPFGGIPDRTFREMSRQQAMDALEGKGSGVRPMDVGRDKAYYDAVVAGTLHRRPWTQFLQPQSSSSRDVQGIPGEYHTRVPSDTMLNHHRSSLVYFPPSPNSINSEHGA